MINKNDILKAFEGSIALNLKIMEEHYNLRSLVVEPPSGSPFFLLNDLSESISLHLPVDRVIGRSALINKSWDIGKQKFISEVTRLNKTPLTLIDIGANVGLFSRQCLSSICNIESAYLFEPHPFNYDLLMKNFSGMKKISLNNFALGPASGILNFYLDGENAGNYSLNKNAMPLNFKEISVPVLSANEQINIIFNSNPGNKFIYKSDTQGYDELISTSISLDFWDCVCCAIFELWRIRDKNYSQDDFIKVLDKFKYKAFEKNPTKQVSANDVIQYLDSEDKRYDDLLLWN
ncbi:FkbM family methyltransferase [Polynucleobacter sp. JS-JIR-II-c23]|uniref:FkbM family methyltransferase n=1 Tax=Polynucleobacter sp. JS-JIR-II-c23 TaxID=1758393 RepID=UPI002B230EE5|nr:FkbM family methyltransferase [Polynucleobacter sp. JS-JIR-II-c23]MEA9603805.1 FkbM family methyltransferase [Polynucleobacter sp. JS-JIR-II-c23]